MRVNPKTKAYSKPTFIYQKQTDETRRVEANIVVEQIHLQPESMKILVEEEINVE